MRRIVMTGAFTLALTLEACAAKQPPTPPPLNLVTEAEPKAEAPPALPTPEQILAEQPPEVQQALKEHDKSGDWAIYRTPGYTLYPYNQGPQPAVDCEPLRTSDIQLQPGETITDVAIGDSERWMATPASSGDPRRTPGRISQLSRKLRASRPTLQSTRPSTSITCCARSAEATRCRRSSSTTQTS